MNGAQKAPAPEHRLRFQVIRQAGAVLHRMHEAACYLQPCTPSAMAAVFQVRCDQGSVEVVLGSVEVVRVRHRPRRRLALRDLRQFLAACAGLWRRADGLRFLLGYLGRPRLTPADRRLARSVLPRRVPA